MDEALILSEHGNPLDVDDRHVATGSNTGGYVDSNASALATSFGFAAGNCCNWTGSNEFMQAAVAHGADDADWAWNRSHHAACTFPENPPEGISAGAHIYCFATD